MNQTEIAKSLAHKWHADQTRRDGATPYTEHLRRVAASVETAEIGESFRDRAVAAAWLHDILEDTPCRADDLLLGGIDPIVISIVTHLTKDPHEPYEDFIARVRNSGRPARAIKLADICDNLTDSPSPSQIEKYKRALLSFA